MKMRYSALWALVASPLLISACGKSDAPPSPSAVPAPVAAPATSEPPPVAQAPVVLAPAPVLPPAPPAALPKLDRLVIQGFAAAVPNAWTPTQPSSSMRVAQFALPAAAGAEGGELAAFFFPTGQGGSQEANIERWVSQFSASDGKPVTPKISTSKSGDTSVTLVELQGTYARGVGMGPAGEAKPNQTLLVALIETPVGRITLQGYGPNKTIAAQRDNFIKLAKGFRSA